MSVKPIKSMSELFITLNLDSYQSYLNRIPYYLNTEQVKLEKQLEIEVENLTQEDAERHFEYNYEDEMHLLKNFHNTFYESLYITLYSFFEKELYKICKRLQNTNTHKIKVNNLAGNGIDKYSLFLSALYDIEISQFNSWDELKKHQKIRNYIVHNDSIYINSQNSIFPIASYLGCLSKIDRGKDISPLFEIRNNKETNSKLINCIKAFFNELFTKALELKVKI